ncbi:hypothetical protein [Parapedobacter lycopersici]|uniref:hypothetical protein n=1 Tax=Parapedobacter lycopersici TaxID=1864939 RepID=UPI00333E3855
MKRQTIYPLLIATLMTVLAMHTQAQTRQDNVSEARIRRLLSKDGTENRPILFSTGAVNKIQTLSINPTHEVSPNSSQELRALIFENYTPPGSRSTALRSATTPQPAHNAGADKLLSASKAEESTGTEQATPPEHTVPTQGDVKEEQ